MIRIKRYIYDYLPAFAAFFIAFSLTVVAFFQLRNWIIEKNKNIFQEQTVQATEKIISRMNEYIQVLKAGRGLFASQDTITRKEWENFYRNIDLEKNYPGIQGIGYAAYLRSETEVEVLESKVKKEGISWFEVLPEGKRNIYCPILFLEPLTWRNQRALGFDMFSEIARRNAMEHARDSMQPTLSSIVTLVQETSENVQNGFLLYLPVYRYKIQQPENIQDRQRSIKGFIYSPFRARDLFNGIFQNRFREMDITLTGIDEKGAQQILYKSVKDSNKLDENQLIKVSYLNIAEQTWKVVYKTNSSFGTITDKIQPILVLLAGTVISFLLFFLFWFFMKIRRANRVLNTVTSNATAALFMVNKQGNCTFINQSAERMLGFSREEYKTMKFDILISESKRSGVKPSQIPFIGSTIKNLEDVFIRKDGTTVNVSISSKPVYDGFELVSTIIEVRDISEEKHAEEKIKSINEDLSKKKSGIEQDQY